MSQTTTVTLNPTGDNSLLIFADLTTFYNGPSTFRDIGLSRDDRAVLMFSLSSIPSGASVVSATLAMQADTVSAGLGGNPGLVPINVYRITKSWDPLSVTGQDRSTGLAWTNPGGDAVGITGVQLANGYASYASNPVNGSDVTWSVNALVQEWLSGTYTNNGFLIRAEAVNSGVLYTDSTAGTAFIPRLTILYSYVATQTPVFYTTTPTTTSVISIDGSNAGTGAGNYSQINSTGAITLNGGTLKPQTTFTGSSGFMPAYGQSFTVLSGTSVTGSYSAIDNSANPSSLKFIAEYKNSQVNVFATPGDYSRDVANLSSSQKSVGKALNGVVTSSVNNRSGVVQSDREKITNALMRLSTPQLQTAIAQMDPTNLQGMSQSVLQGSQMLQSGFRGRLDQLQAGTQGGVTVNGMSLTNLQGDYEYELVADMEIPYLVKRQRKLASYWINGTGSWGDVENEAQNSGYQFYGMGSQIGMDYTLANDWTVGLMLWEGYERSSLAMRDSLLKSHRGGGGFYAHKEWCGFYWGGYAGAGKVFYETDRSVDFLAERATGETEGILLQGWNELGYEMRWKNWGFGPTLGVGFNRVMIDGYQETGSSAALQLDDQTQDSLSHQLGFRVQSFWKWLGIGIQPSLRMSWDHEYLTPKEMNSKFVAGGEWFQSSLRELDRETMGTRIGLTLLPGDHWSVTTSYQTQLLATQYSAHSVDLGVRYGF